MQGGEDPLCRRKGPVPVGRTYAVVARDQGLGLYDRSDASYVVRLQESEGLEFPT